MQLSHHLVSEYYNWKTLKPFLKHLLIAIGIIMVYNVLNYLYYRVQKIIKKNSVDFQSSALPNYFRALRKESLKDFLEDE